MIICRNLSKNFVSYQKSPGILASLRSLFYRPSLLKCAVDQFNLEVGNGEVVGLLGPNGAGKTTLMKLFTGIVVPSSGELTVMGFTPSNRDLAYRQQIAMVMGQKSQLWWDLPAIDSFQLLSRYYQIPRVDFKSRLKVLSELLDIGPMLNTQMRKMSLGERMKMELMASLLHRPKLLFLDEPTIGLDLVAQDRIRDFIKTYRQQEDVTIILTSHYMADVKALCERIVLIQNGKKGYDGPTSQFENILGNEKLVTFNFSQKLSEQDQRLFDDISGVWNDNGQTVEVKIPEDKLRERTAHILHNFPVINFQSDKLPIERVMKALMEKSIGHSP